MDMSAVEVLRKIDLLAQAIDDEEVTYRFDRKELNALGDAVLALEKQEKLKEWLDKTEKLAVRSNKFYEFRKGDYYSARIKTIKEVRGFLL